MEAMLPGFAGSNANTRTVLSLPPEVELPGGRTVKSCRIPLQKAILADTHAPMVSLPLRFMITGIVSLVLVVALLIMRPDILSTYHYNQYVLAATHLMVLGFITTIVMGAMYQLVPVALETKLYSEKLARRQFWAHAIGFVGMVWMFWIWDMKQVGHFASVFALGVGWFVYNMARTLKQVPKWNVVARGVASVLFWLSFTVLAGLYLAASKCWNFSPFDAIAAMHAHAHVGVVGVFLLLILSVSYKLVPMFVLGDLQSERRAACSLWLVNAGLLGTFVTVLLQSTFKALFALVIVAGLAVYGWEIASILRHRKRKVLDWGLRGFVTGLAILVPVAGLGLFLSWPGVPLTGTTGQLENLYGFLGLMGVIAFAILGMLYKIMPFLVWYHSYSKWVGRARVPSLGDLYSTRLQAAGYCLFLAGVSATCVGIVLASEAGVRLGAVILATSLAVLAMNVALILRHWIRPVIEPMTAKPSAQGALA